MSPPLPAGFALLAANLAARLRDYSGRASARGTRGSHEALGCAKRPQAAHAGGRGVVPGRRPAIIGQEFATLCLFKPPPAIEPYPPRPKNRPLSGWKRRGVLGRLSAAVADRPEAGPTRG